MARNSLLCADDVPLRNYSLMHFIWIEREFNACQTPRSMYTSVFNRFPVIQPKSSKVRHFSTFFAHFGLPRVRPWDNRGKFTRMEIGFNAGQMHRSMYAYIFNRLRAIARYWSEIATFFYPLAFNTSVWGCSHWNSGKKFGSHITRIMRLPDSEDSLTIV